MVVRAVDPHAITEPAASQTGWAVALGMQKDQLFARGGLGGQEEALKFADGGRAFCEADEKDAVGLGDASLCPGRVDVGVGYVEDEAELLFEVCEMLR